MCQKIIRIHRYTGAVGRIYPVVVDIEVALFIQAGQSELQFMPSIWKGKVGFKILVPLIQIAPESPNACTGPSVEGRQLWPCDINGGLAEVGVISPGDDERILPIKKHLPELMFPSQHAACDGPLRIGQYIFIERRLRLVVVSADTVRRLRYSVLCPEQ